MAKLEIGPLSGHALHYRWIEKGVIVFRWVPGWPGTQLALSEI